MNMLQNQHDAMKNEVQLMRLATAEVLKMFYKTASRPLNSEVTEEEKRVWEEFKEKYKNIIETS